MHLFTADWIHFEDTFRADHAILLDDEGRIVAAGPRATIEGHPEAVGAQRHEYPGRAISPGTVSAHSHAFQVFLRGAGDHPLGFQDWVKRYLYPLIEGLDDASLEAAALLCFSQMVQAGITTVGEFHYIHNAQNDYDARHDELSHIVIRAARRVGLRVAFLRTIYDVQERVGQGRMAQGTATAVEGIRRLHREYAGDPATTVLPAPHSLHGATREAVEAGAALAAELGCRWHIHLAEQHSDVGYSQRIHEGTPLEVLDSWGVLDRRTVVVHGIWLSEAERSLLAERGGGLVSNPTTNMALGDGIAPLTDLVHQGVHVGLGTDMNAAPNVFAEMRAAEYLQRVKKLTMGCLPRTKIGSNPEPARIFDMGTRWGAETLGIETGAFEPGFWGDFLVIDLDDPSLLPGAVLGGDALLNALSSSMVPQTAIREVWVGGKRVAQGGAVDGLDRDELVARVRESSAIRAFVNLASS